MVTKTLKQYPRLRCALAAAGAVLALLPFTLHADTVDLSTLPEDLRDLTAEERQEAMRERREAIVEGPIKLM